MAKGWSAIEEAAAASAAQRERFAAGFKPELRLNSRSPGPWIIRFLEQGVDVNNFPIHNYKVPNQNVQGGFSTRRFTCLMEINQECPACRAGMKQGKRGVYNLIQRQRPQYRKDADGKAVKVNNEYIIDGHQDEVVIASVGQPTANLLRKVDADYHGLMSRDFVVAYSGDAFQSWHIAPADTTVGAVAMSQDDVVLSQSKYNLDEFMKPPTVQEVNDIIAKYGGNSGASSRSGGPSHAQSVAPPAATGFLAGASVPAGAAANAFGSLPGGASPPQQQAQPPQTPTQ